MKIYINNFKEGYQNIGIKNEEVDDCLDELANDYRIMERWPHVELEICDKGKKNDFPYFWNNGRILVISERAKNTLVDFFKNESFELLPMFLNDECYYIVHIINVEQTKNHFKENKNHDIQQIFDIEYLKKNNIYDKGIFRVYLTEDEADEEVFITEKFIEMVKNTDLKGASYELIWDSEADYSDFK